MMDFVKLSVILTCYLTIFTQKTMAQYGGMVYYPYGGYNGVGSTLDRRIGTYPNGIGGGYPSYGYYPQYPIYGNYLCYRIIYCGGSYPGYGGYQYLPNSLSTAFASSSSSNGFSTAYASSGGGFFG